MVHPGEDGEAGTGEEELGPNAAAMRDLLPENDEQQEAQTAPPLGEFYMGLANEAESPALRQSVAHYAEIAFDRPRIWRGEDQPKPANLVGPPPVSEAAARQTMQNIIADADEWLRHDEAMRTGDRRSSRTLLDIGDDLFDEALLGELVGAFGMRNESQPMPQTGEHAQPERFESVVYDTALPGVQVQGWRHRRDGNNLADPGTVYTKYFLVNAAGGPNRLR